MKINKFNIIILVVILMTGLSITGWAISSYYEISTNTVDLPEELIDNMLTADTPVRVIPNSTILFLISTGLIGLVSVRRQRKVFGSLQTETNH